MGFIRHARGDGSGLTARDGNGIDIAHEIEGHGASIRGDVNTHPCAFLGVEFDLAFRFQRKGREFGMGNCILFRRRSIRLGLGSGGHRGRCRCQQ